MKTILTLNHHHHHHHHHQVYLMCALKHPNIVNLYGICIPSEGGVVGGGQGREKKKGGEGGIVLDRSKLGVVMEVF